MITHSRLYLAFLVFGVFAGLLGFTGSVSSAPQHTDHADVNPQIDASTPTSILPIVVHQSVAFIPRDDDTTYALAELSGVGEPQEHLSVLINKLESTRIIVQANGLWNYTAELTAPGVYIVEVYTVEDDGTQGVRAAELTIILAPTVAQMPVVSDTSLSPQAAPVTGTVSANLVTETATPAPTATPTPFPTSTATPTAVAVFDPGILQLSIAAYRLFEKQAVETVDQDRLAQLPIYAAEEALASLQTRIIDLAALNQYQVLVVSQLDVVHVVQLSDIAVGVLVHEKYSLRTYQRTSTGNQLVREEIFAGEIVYGLIYADGSWKVERIRKVE